MKLGTAPRALTLRRVDPARPGSDGHPHWSPNGRQVAFHRSRGESFDIYVVAATGRARPRLIGEGFEPA